MKRKEKPSRVLKSIGKKRRSALPKPAHTATKSFRGARKNLDYSTEAHACEEQKARPHPRFENSEGLGRNRYTFVRAARKKRVLRLMQQLEGNKLAIYRVRMCASFSLLGELCGEIMLYVSLESRGGYSLIVCSFWGRL